VANALGYKTGGSYHFFYAVKQLKHDKMIRDKRGGSKGKMLLPRGYNHVKRQKRKPRCLRELDPFNVAGEKE